MKRIATRGLGAAGQQARAVSASRAKLRSSWALLAVAATCALSAITASSALAAGAPLAETGIASEVTETSATLHGRINPNGAETEYYYEYGTSPSYGQSTAVATIAAGTGWTKNGLVKSISGLTRYTTYHYRIVAKNSYGSAYGEDHTFASVPPAPAFLLREGEKQFYPQAFEFRSERAVWQPNGASWTCSGLTGVGTISAAKTVSATTIDFTGCWYESLGSRHECKTEGANPEEIRTEETEGSLVYLSKSAKTVGIDFKKATGSFICNGTGGKLRGSIVFPITPVNTSTKSFTLTSTQGNKEYESESGGKLTASLESNYPSTYGPLYWLFESSFTTGGKIEIEA